MAEKVFDNITGDSGIVVGPVKYGGASMYDYMYYGDMLGYVDINYDILFKNLTFRKNYGIPEFINGPFFDCNP